MEGKTTTLTALKQLLTGPIVFVFLISCGANSEPGTEGTVFSDPTDAQSLSSALITGANANDRERYWQCSFNNSEVVLAYRLYADGSGTETDTVNPNIQSDFTWQAISGRTMTTTVNDSGLQNSFSQIQFNGTNSMVLVANNTATLECSKQGSTSTTQTTAARNSLSYGGVNYELTHGFEESFGYQPTSGDTHKTSEFQVANGEFRNTQIFVSGTIVNVWRPNNGTVWLRADLHSPGGGFQSATFTHEPDSVDDSGQLVAGRFFFNEGRFGIDINRNGSIDTEDNEFTDISGGTISVDRTAGAMSFDVVLSNGVTLIGEFQGNFPVFDSSN